ncbi:hypothetical protein EOD39_6411 [Acipenser ruthenus]|uniref:Uncharacterized protein n=1 Tax=Acipenser ruthenus TaxID=7906 RepID=A0A662Z047_ACIRT|nr:hypothetical protein EOD39_6411 [Acipenser ruthenus]
MEDLPHINLTFRLSPDHQHSKQNKQACMRSVSGSLSRATPQASNRRDNTDKTKKTLAMFDQKTVKVEAAK